MALTIAEILRAVNPNIGLILNADGSYRIGVEDVNSDEILAAAVAANVDLAAIEAAVVAIRATTGAVGDAVVAAGAVGTISAKLRRLTTDVAALLTGIVLAAGTAIIGWVMYKRVPVTTNTTGTNTAVATLTPAADFQLKGIRFNVSTGAPLAAGETLTVTADIGAGAAYDTVLFTSDLGTAGINDVVIEFEDSPVYAFLAADSIVIALSANAGGDTWGCQTIHELT